MNSHWHLLTLQELLTCWSERHPVEGRSGDEPKPPRSRTSDNLSDYILLRWCPWFIGTFGALTERHINMLTRQVLLDQKSIPLVLMNTFVVAIHILRQPNSTQASVWYKHHKLAESYLLKNTTPGDREEVDVTRS